MLTTEEKKILLSLARNTIEQYITKGIIIRFETDDPALKQPCGLFVTLHIMRPTALPDGRGNGH
jgi:AMMECR1 domain-containing protein